MHVRAGGLPVCWYQVWCWVAADRRRHEHDNVHHRHQAHVLQRQQQIFRVGSNELNVLGLLVNARPKATGRLGGALGVHGYSMLAW